MIMIAHTANINPILNISNLLIQVRGEKMTNMTISHTHIGTSYPVATIVTEYSVFIKNAKGPNVKQRVKKA